MCTAVFSSTVVAYMPHCCYLILLGLGDGVIAGISVAIVILFLGVFILTTVTLIWKFHHHLTVESDKKDLSNGYKIPEDVPRKCNNVDMSRNSTISCVDDNNCDNLIETLANEKNSYSTIV